MNQFVEVATFNYTYEADTALVYLESCDLPCHLKDYSMVQIYPWYSNAVGGIKLMVNSEDASRAVELLQSGGYLNERGQRKIPIEEVVKWAKDRTKCPFCQSEDIGKSKQLSMLAVPFYVVISFFLPIYRGAYRCFNCSKHWRYW
jgi:hypothetical protein